MKWIWISVLLIFVAFAGFMVSGAVLRQTELSVWTVRTVSAVFGLICAGSLCYPTRLFVESFQKGEEK